MNLPGYLGVYVISALAFLSAVAAINFVVDPTQLFHVNPKLVDILLEGKNVANPGNYDSRRLEKAYILRSHETNEVVAFGSSRVMQLTTDEVGNDSFFNHAVSGATLEDFVAIYQLLVENDKSPETVIVGLDPWVFNKNSGQTRWREVAEAYRRGLERLNTAGQPGLESKFTVAWDKFRSLVSREYLMESFRQLRADPAGDSYATDEDDLPHMVIRSDGSISYNREVRQRSAEEASEVAQTFAANDPFYSLGGYEELDPDLLRIYEAWFKDLLDRGVQVVVLLIPLHPVVYEQLMSDPRYQIIDEVETRIREISAKYGVVPAGSFDPEVNDCGPEDFYDALHAKATCLVKLGLDIR